METENKVISQNKTTNNNIKLLTLIKLSTTLLNANKTMNTWLQTLNYIPKIKILETLLLLEQKIWPTTRLFIYFINKTADYIVLWKKGKQNF